MEAPKIIYLGLPYTFNPYLSFEIANRVAAKLMQKGYVVFSPISHSHPISDHMADEMRISQQFWMHQDLPILGKCDEFHLIYIGKNGQKLINESKGCQAEIKKATELGLPIKIHHYEP